MRRLLALVASLVAVRAPYATHYELERRQSVVYLGCLGRREFRACFVSFRYSLAGRLAETICEFGRKVTKRLRNLVER